MPFKSTEAGRAYRLQYYRMRRESEQYRAREAEYQRKWKATHQDNVRAINNGVTRRRTHQLIVPTEQLLTGFSEEQ